MIIKIQVTVQKNRINWTYTILDMRVQEAKHV